MPTKSYLKYRRNGRVSWVGHSERIANSNRAKKKMVGDFVIGEKGAFSDCAQESFTLPSRYYTDPSIHDQEMSAIFQCSWLYVGHVSDLPDVGSYLTEEVAGQPILIVRSQDNTLRAFFNVCQHRGHTLLSGRGQLKGQIVCPYHAWCYGLDGALLSARMTRDIPNFDLAEFPLKPVQLAMAAGLLFVNFDPAASTADSDLLDFEETIIGHIPEMSKYAVKYRFDFDIAANWKVIIDNFSEGYHIPIAHPILSTLYNEKGGSSRIGKYFGYYQKTARAGFEKFGTKGGEPYVTWFLWPNLCLLSLPESPQLIVLRISPNGPRRSLEHADIYSPIDVDSPNLEMIKSLFAEMFNQEDIALVESVQRGLDSLGYDQGRYVADPAESWFTDSGLHRFHSQIIEALGR